MSTKKVPHYLVTALNAIKLKNKVSNYKLRCDVCNFVAQTGIDLRKSGTDDETISQYFVDMCTIILGSAECKREMDINLVFKVKLLILF